MFFKIIFYVFYFLKMFLCSFNVFVFLMWCVLLLSKHKRTKLQIGFIYYGQIAFSCF